MSEHCLRIDPKGAITGPAILLVPPLFDEANRLRRTLVLTMRALADRGHAALLPDLPGQNDSLVQTETVDLPIWREALAGFATSVDQPLIVASWRGGALIDDGVDGAIGWWRMAPVSGASLLKTLLRTRIAGERERGHQVTADGLRALLADGPIELGGNRLNKAMVAALDAAKPGDVAPLRVVTPGAGSDEVVGIAGSALWLRAEPGEDAAMAQAMANDISRWADQCAAG